MMFLIFNKVFFLYIIHRKFIVIRSETNEKMDPEEYYPPSINSHCIFAHPSRRRTRFAYRMGVGPTSVRVYVC